MSMSTENPRLRYKQLLDGATSSGASEETAFPPANFTISVDGISGDTVKAQYRTVPTAAWTDLNSFTADGEKVIENDLVGEVRFNITTYSAGTVNAYVIYCTV